MTPKQLKDIMTKFDDVNLFPSQIFLKFEDIFTLINSKYFYSPQSILGLDDDKPRISGDSIVKWGLPRFGGKTTRTFPKVHELNCISSALTIGRASQSQGQSESSCTLRMLNILRQQMQIPIHNLFVIDRGYTTLLQTFRYGFGTLKTGYGTNNVFTLDRLHQKATENPNHYYIEKPGIQTLYGVRVNRPRPDQTLTPEIQLAFGSGSGSVTCLLIPHPPVPQCQPFTSQIVGKWSAEKIQGERARRIKRIYPTVDFKPLDMRSAFQGLKYLTSSQTRDVFWIYARFGLWTSRSAAKVISKISGSGDLNLIEGHREILLFLNQQTMAQTNQSTVESVAPNNPNSPSSWLGTLTQDKRRLWNWLRQFNLTLENGRPLTGRTAKSTMIERAQLFFSNHPNVPFVRPVSPSNDSRFLPLFLEGTLLKPLNSDGLHHLRKGQENEDNLTAELPETLRHWSAQQFEIIAIGEVGLIADAETLTNYALASSPDRIALVRNNFTQSVFPCLIEFKTATSTVTMNELSLEAYRQGRFLQGSPITGDQLTDLVPLPFQVQLLHHAASIGIHHVLLVRGNYILPVERARGIISTQQISLIEFRHSDIIKYRELVGSLNSLLQINDFNNTLRNYPNESISTRLQALNIVDHYDEANRSWFRDIHSLAISFRLAKLIQEFPDPPPPARRLIPVGIVLWNKFKGHSDIGSRVKEDNKLRIKTGPGSKVMNRLLMSQLHNVWRIVNLFENYHRIQAARTIEQFRAIFSKDVEPFRRFLLKSTSAINAAANVNSPETVTTRKRTTPLRQLSAKTRLSMVRNQLLESNNVGELFERVQTHLPERGNQLACAHCEGTRIESDTTRDSRTPQTIFRCGQCNIPLHPPSSKSFPECWKRWHSMLCSGESYAKRSTLIQRRKSAKAARLLVVDRSTEDDREFIVDEVSATSLQDELGMSRSATSADG